ncbi:hypothetical protein N0A02_26900 [Paraburkholderia acidicola]|uniref:Uncharacterized protein n=1 Tax=Paraburkholderia acidicola TaxID=1912599 RepID=A0ABV1LUV6_9BURK
MNEPVKQKSRFKWLRLIGLGGLLLLFGIPCWYYLGSALMLLAPFAEWPKALATVGIFLPLLFGMAWKYDTGRKNEIGYVVFGWVTIGFALGGIFLFLLSLVPHGG